MISPRWTSCGSSMILAGRAKSEDRREIRTKEDAKRIVGEIKINLDSVGR